MEHGNTNHNGCSKRHYITVKTDPEGVTTIPGENYKKAHRIFSISLLNI
jgi:hypothetical protein